MLNFRKKVFEHAALERAAQTISNQEAAIKSLQRDRDSAYRERNQCIVLICHMALELGLRAGLGKRQDVSGESENNDWRNVVFVDLPSGQVSWRIHDSELPMFGFLPPYQGEWDGHTTHEKYARVLHPRLANRPTQLTLI